METPREESDQLPEEAPAEQVPDDAGSGAKPGRDTADGDSEPADENATGHPPDDD